MQKIVILLIFLGMFSCRKKVSDDYLYYKPYKRDTATLFVPKKQLIDSITANDSQLKPESFPPANPNDKYFIVVASFSVEEYALNMKSEMLKLGFKPEIIIVNNDGWNKLAICSYNNFDLAQDALINIKKRMGIFTHARLVVK